MLHWGRRFTNSFLANALNSRGIAGAGNPGRFALRTDGHRTMPLVRSESVAEYGALTANPAFPLSVHAEADPRG